MPKIWIDAGDDADEVDMAPAASRTGRSTHTRLDGICREPDPGDDPRKITLAGKIVSGDARRLDKMIPEDDRAIVFLHSNRDTTRAVRHPSVNNPVFRLSHVAGSC